MEGEEWEELEKAGPLSASMMLAEKIHLLIGRIYSVLIWSIFTSVWLSASGILYIIEQMNIEFLSVYAGILWYWVFYAGGIGVAITLPLTLYHAYQTRKALINWDDKFIDFSYVVNFELFEPEGDTPQEKIFNQLLRSFPKLRDAIEQSLKKGVSIKDFLNVEISDKKSYKFDIFIGDVYTLEKKALGLKRFLPFQRIRIKNFIEDYGYIFVRRFDTTDPIGKNELIKFQKDALGALKEKKLGEKLLTFLTSPIFKREEENFFLLMAVSTATFTEEAIEWAEKEEKIPIDLIEEEKEGYKVIFY